MNLILISWFVGSISLFNEKPIYNNPLAYVRTPVSSISVERSKYKGTYLEYLNATIGKSIPIITFKNENNQIQLGLEGGGWFVLGYDDGTYPMITQDFYFSFPLYYKFSNKISGALKFNHISSHQGDGMDFLLEQELNKDKKRQIRKTERNLDVNIDLSHPLVYSRDYVTFEIAKEFKLEDLDAKIYTQIGYIHKTYPSNLGRWFVADGIEIKYNNSSLSPYYAQDFRYNQDTDSLDYSSQLGLINNNNKLYEFRIALTTYIGSDRRGQFVGNHIKQFGIGFFFQ